MDRAYQLLCQQFNRLMNSRNSAGHVHDLFVYNSLLELNRADWFISLNRFCISDTLSSKLQKLAFLSANTDWWNNFYRRVLMTSMVVWYREENDDLPNLLNIFHRHQIELLIGDAIDRMCDDQLEKEVGEKFVEIVARSGYKHEPSANRLTCTPIHYAVDRKQLGCLKNLFAMYDNCDVNYQNKAGLTHLHAACMGSGCENVVERLLERGRADPNQAWPKTSDSPLHLCARHTSVRESGIILLRNGAVPNPTNRDESTPLHIIVETDDYDTASEYFEIYEKCEQMVLIDARDAKGRTPLQMAVAKLWPDLVQLLLDRGADVAQFAFPSVEQFNEICEYMQEEYEDSWKIKMSACLMACADMLERRGYELTYEDVLTIMELFEREGLFEKRGDNVAHPTNYSEEFMAKAKTIKHKDTSLYDLLVMDPEEARRRFSFQNYEHIADDNFTDLPREFVENCSRHLAEKLSKRFFVKWTEEEMYQVLRQRLLIELCAKILQKMSNQDIYNVCLAAKQQRDEIGQVFQEIARAEAPRRSQRIRRAPERLQVGL